MADWVADMLNVQSSPGLESPPHEDEPAQLPRALTSCQNSPRQK
jgi:hypothetical protein